MQNWTDIFSDALNSYNNINNSGGSVLKTIYKEFQDYEQQHGQLPGISSPLDNDHQEQILEAEPPFDRMTPIDDEWLHKVIYCIRMLFIPIIIIGTATNVMNFSVLAQKEMRCRSTSVYLLALAVADLGIMYTELFRVWFEIMDLVDPKLYFSDLYCKFSNFINGVVRDFSNWLIACMTLERVIMVGSPFHAKTLCTVKQAKRITLTLLFALSIPHSHCIIFSKAQLKTWWVCWEDPDSKVASVFAAVVEITVGYIVVIVVFILNIVLTVLLFKNARHRKKCKRSSDFRRKFKRRLTRTLCIVAVVFVVCETPRIIMSFVCRFIQRTAIIRIILNISFVLSGINHASNFWIYVFSSPRFRHIFLRQFHRIKHGGAPGNTVIKAKSVLKENGVIEIHFKLSNVVFETAATATDVGRKEKKKLLNNNDKTTSVLYSTHTCTSMTSPDHCGRMKTFQI